MPCHCWNPQKATVSASDIYAPLNGETDIIHDDYYLCGLHGGGPSERFATVSGIDYELIESERHEVPGRVDTFMRGEL